MAAMRIDREDLRARARQQHLFVADMTKLCNVGKSR
jgi:hypothetical protein